MLAARVQGREEKATDSAASNKAVEAELAAIKAALQLGLDLAVAPGRRSSRSIRVLDALRIRFG